ncbi:CoA transferase [Puniceibacterium sp. IMCC21224]|uniref:CoA transferase n=1 Tax=Puniceibacterium sp. IMCC21224 TaxID=1618204 RepID=UPI00064D75BF|nr:CoA transferase [Puniceibacterium sp. IMCC21224]KMK64931.1 putative acyl-CoA transferase/carnitine dehydratase [Puniceibacterium sp. IMCC21224]
MQPYTGIRILDLSHWLGSYAGRLFADLGAEVIRVEPPEGLPDRQNATAGQFAFLNASKKSVTIAPEGQGGFEALVNLAEAAEVVMLERGSPFWHREDALRARCPHLVITCTSPYGRTGPLADAPASDLTVQSAGGIAWMSGRIDNAPLRLPFGQASMLCGIYAAVATAICLRDAERSRHGHLIDVSAQEAIAHSLQNAIQVWDLEQRISSRGGEGTRDASEDVFPCKDGHIFFAAPPSLPKAWTALVAWMTEVGHPSGPALSKPRWTDAEWRKTIEAKSAFRALFLAFIKDFTQAEIRHQAMTRKLITASVARFPDLVEDPQLKHREFFHDVSGRPFPGPPYLFSEPVWAVSAAPKLGKCQQEAAQ